MKVIELLPFLKGFDIDVIIVDRVNTHQVNGDVLSKFVAADPTGAVSLTFWGIDGTNVRPGDILRITGAETKLYQNQIELTKSKTGKAKRIGEHTFPFTDRPNISREWTWTQDSKQRWEATKDGSNPSLSVLDVLPKPPANKPNTIIPKHHNSTPANTPAVGPPAPAPYLEAQSRKRPSPPGREKGIKNNVERGTIQQRNTNFANQFSPAGGGLKGPTRSQNGPMMKKSRGMISGV